MHVVLSPGRCGTQWLTKTLAEIYPHEVVVRHEPLGGRWCPRRFFRMYAHSDAVLELPEVRAHLEWIDALGRPYIETGWPLYGALPYLAERFGEELHVIHLTRHPVPAALSHLAHNSFAGSARDDEYTRLATLGPDDAGVFQSDYVNRWAELTPFEKCLFWITEVGAYGLEFEERYANVPFLRVMSEDMLGGDERTLRTLVDFLDLDWDPRWLGLAAKRVDRWHHHTDREIDPFAIERHPFALATARRLGYDPLAVDPTALRARYSGTPHEGAAT